MVGALLVALIVFPSRSAASQDSSNPGLVSLPVKGRDSEGRVTVRAIRVSEQDVPRIDGILDEALYQRLPAITDFIQQDPHEGELATEPTLVWLMFDDKNIYIAARCRDSQPHRIVANDMRRDGSNVSQNDNLSVVIDTYPRLPQRLRVPDELYRRRVGHAGYRRARRQSQLEYGVGAA